MSVKLSIGSAVYNVKEPFLRKHIESIIEQLTDESELLLIDDCSTDNSGGVCREYAGADSRVRYIKMDKNGGLSSVRNRTIEEAEGEWIFFADDDDILSDHAVETALSFCRDDLDIIIHDRAIFHENNPKAKSERKNDFIEFINTEPFKSAINDYHQPNAWWGWRIPVELARKQKFATLDFLIKHWSFFRLYGGLADMLAGKK